MEGPSPSVEFGSCTPTPDRHTNGSFFKEPFFYGKWPVFSEGESRSFRLWERSLGKAPLATFVSQTITTPTLPVIGIPQSPHPQAGPLPPPTLPKTGNSLEPPLKLRELPPEIGRTKNLGESTLKPVERREALGESPTHRSLRRNQPSLGKYIWTASRKSASQVAVLMRRRYFLAFGSPVP